MPREIAMTVQLDRNLEHSGSRAQHGRGGPGDAGVSGDGIANRSHGRQQGLRPTTPEQSEQGRYSDGHPQTSGHQAGP